MDRFAYLNNGNAGYINSLYDIHPDIIARPESSSTATGSARHAAEQATVINRAFEQDPVHVNDSFSN